jgi:macrolide transport system ATP-binding/permease protein
MNPLRRFLRKLSMLAGRKRFLAELDEEMAFHREQAERDLLPSGMTPEAALFCGDATVWKHNEG